MRPPNQKSLSPIEIIPLRNLNQLATHHHLFSPDAIRSKKLHYFDKLNEHSFGMSKRNPHIIFYTSTVKTGKNNCESTNN